MNVVHYLVIQPKIISVFQFLEERLSIKIDIAVVRRMLFEAEDISIEEREYIFFAGQRSFFTGAIHISGTVEEHDLKTLLLIIEGIGNKDAVALDEFLKTNYPIGR